MAMETSMAVNQCDRMDANTSSNRPTKGGWKAAIFIMFVEFGERFAYYGVSGNLINYLTRGLLMLVISVVKIHPNHQVLPFFIALHVINIGEGGHRPCIQTFAADQFDDGIPEEKAVKNSFFNWWYLGIVLGGVSGTLAVSFVQFDISWGWGFAIPAMVVAAAFVVFLAGKNTYRREVKVGSPITKVAQVIVAAVKKRNLSLENEFNVYVQGEESGAAKTRLLARTNQFRFLDKAAIIDDRDKSAAKHDEWRLCTVNEVEQVKLLMRLLPIWISCIIFTIVIAQLGTFYTLQAEKLNRTIGSTRFKIPAASFQVIPGLTILTVIPFYERVIIPTSKHLTKHPSGITMLQRIGFGIFFSILTMIVAALVESKRSNVAKHQGLMDDQESVFPMSAWWLVPQYVLMGVADMLTIVGLQELFYDQVPDEMRSLGAAAYLSILGVGSFMSSALVSVVRMVTARRGDEWLKGRNLNTMHLDYFYWLLACLSGFGLVIFVVLAKGFVYKKLQRDAEA
ncbi:major facilitator superfamily protein [Artemisia annua]|uniref:Major facilitator superfamily protein n=1 Tax=Artemisia annua TaxID=35608 RepID=A0A2U1MVD6_ARTAN|nr:major facilitator superfamily protein [Artemisia annua]